MNNMESIISRIKAEYITAKENMTTSDYWKLSTTLSEAEEGLREYIQEITSDQITLIINKLQGKDTLSKEDLDFIKLWIVQDADSYAKLENNFNDWVAEIDRLMGEYSKFVESDMNYEEASRLRSMLLDGIRVLGDIVFFLKQKDRVKNFTEATGQLNEEERDLLIRLLRGKMISDRE